MDDSSYKSLDRLEPKDAFMFQGDVLKEVYYYVGLKAKYAKVVSDKEDITNPEKWALVSRNSIVAKVKKDV